MFRILPFLPCCRPFLILALLFAQQPEFVPNSDTPGFSFEKVMLPSLADINAGRFKKHLEGTSFQLTNVDPLFDRNFVLIHDEITDHYTIRNKRGDKLFEERIDGIPRFAASLNLGSNSQPSVILDIAAFGNHGNGMETYQALVPDAGRLTPLQNPIHTEFMNGQENRSGTLTWYVDSRVYAVFEGEEAKLEVTGQGTEVGSIANIREIWGRSGLAMILLSKTSTPMDQKDARHLTFR